MAKPSKAGRSPFGVAAVWAMEAFTPLPQRLFEDRIALHFLPPFARFLLRRAALRRAFIALFDRSAPGIRGALLCRTRRIDDAIRDALRRAPRRTVVILGAGLDARPYRLPELADIPVLEIDLASSGKGSRSTCSRTLWMRCCAQSPNGRREPG